MRKKEKGLVRRTLVQKAERLGFFDGLAKSQSNIALAEFIISKNPTIPVRGHTKNHIISAVVKWCSKGDKGGVSTRKPSSIAKALKYGSSSAKSPGRDTKAAFYLSWEWRTLRMEALKEHGARCQCCGAKPTDTDMAGKPVKICVDHIKPISKFWNLRLDKKNLQILCDECNQGKGAWDETDWRDGGDLAETAQTDELTAAFRATLQ